MCNRLPEIYKNGDAGIFPVYYSLKEKSENCFAYIAQHYLQQSMKMFLHVLSRMYSSSSTFYAQNPALGSRLRFFIAIQCVARHL